MVLQLANTHLGLKSLMQKLKLRASRDGLFSHHSKWCKLFKSKRTITTLLLTDLAHLCNQICIAALKHIRLVPELGKFGDGQSDQIPSSPLSLIIRSMSTGASLMLTKRLNPICATNVGRLF